MPVFLFTDIDQLRERHGETMSRALTRLTELKGELGEEAYGSTLDRAQAMTLARVAATLAEKE